MVLTNLGKIDYRLNGFDLQAYAIFKFWKEVDFMDNRCFVMVKTTAVAIVGNQLVLTIPAGNYYDCENVKICICQTLPAGILPTQTVGIKLGTAATIYPTRTKCGHNIYTDQVSSRKPYVFKVATDTATFTYIDGCPLKCTAHISPPVLAPIVSES